jgi:23S rRNA pseudouridine1911/1915/1917 synthase
MPRRKREPEPEPIDESPFAEAMPDTASEAVAPDIDADVDIEPADDDLFAGGQTLRFELTRQNPLRLDKYLQQAIKSVSRNQIQKLIDLAAVTVNGKPGKASQKLAAGDVIEVTMPPRPAVDLRPEPIPLNILYEDEDFIVVNKPAGLIVHPARTYLSGTLLNALAHHFQQNAPPDADATESLSNVGRAEARPGVVHRLDLNTTGVIVVAKRDETHWMLARQFEHRTNLKVYLALVHGCPPTPGDQTGDAIDLPIGKHPTIREAMAVRFDSQGKDSLTLYRVRERYQGYSLVELELKTGRTHQIRVHLSYLGCPIVGDVLYGGEVVGEREVLEPPRPAGSRPHIVFARDREAGLALEAWGKARRDAGELVMFTPALHAAMLQLTHPVTRQRMTFTAPVHPPMLQMIHRLRQRPAPGHVAANAFIDLSQAAPE